MLEWRQRGGQQAHHEQLLRNRKLSAYSVLTHRHVPEVLQVSGLEGASSASRRNRSADRGILGSLPTTMPQRRELLAIYESTTRANRSCGCTNPGHMPDPAVARTNPTSASPSTRNGRAVSAIDNLVKGAAGQAVNMNLMLIRRSGGC
jgi:N-acetyl-gamma-glutamyl-phosphate reductase